MKLPTNLQNSILLVEDMEVHPERQARIQAIIARANGWSCTTENYLIDTADARKTAELIESSRRGNLKPNSNWPRWAWKVSDPSSYALILLHSSNAYAEAFLDQVSLEPSRVIIYSGNPRDIDANWDNSPKSKYLVIDNVQLESCLPDFLRTWNGNTPVADVFGQADTEEQCIQALYAYLLVFDSSLSASESGRDLQTARIKSLQQRFLRWNTVDDFLGEALRGATAPRIAVRIAIKQMLEKVECWPLSVEPQRHSTVEDRGRAKAVLRDVLAILCEQRRSSKIS